MKKTGRLVASSAAFALLWRLHAPPPPAPDVSGVAAMLSAAVQGHVNPADFIWEKNRNILSEALWGRNLLFLASSAPGAPRDLYRARVRVSLEGYPIEVASWVNLTSTPLGDDANLTADGPYASRYAAFATWAYGSVANATLLDLQGDGGISGARSLIEEQLGKLTNWQETGSLRGLGKVEFAWEHPASHIALSIDTHSLSINISDNSYVHFDFNNGALQGNPNNDITAQRIPHLRKNPTLWMVDTVRSWVGPEPIAWLEATFFGARDTLRRTSYQLFGKAAAAATTLTEQPPSASLDASAATSNDDGFWPPATLASIWKTPDTGEGVWEPATYAFLKKLPSAKGDPPPYFYKTWVKPDLQRPYAKVLIVALDTRQLELNMEGGVEDPKPLTGTKSIGRIPRDPDTLSRVVGAFNGAFKTTHGAYGMMANKRILLPPKPDAATVVVTDDHRVGMGTWPKSEEIPTTLLSFRQNLDPLVEDGKLNPVGRVQWGFQLPGTSVMTERSGLCVTQSGHLMYFWGDDVSALTLGKAMIQAGCSYGMHLDMNPKHTGFVFAAIRDITHKDYDARLLSSQMEIMPERYIEWSPKDFFYILLRKPDAQPQAETSEIRWSPDHGLQPAPTWLPALFESFAVASGVQVQLFGIDPDRSLFRLRAGSSDASPRTLNHDLTPEEGHKTLAAISLGSPRSTHPLGLRVDGQQPNLFHGHNGYLTIDTAGQVHISNDDPSSDVPCVVELPLLITNGKATSFSEERSSMRYRTAACVLSTGRVIIASSTSNTDQANTIALLKTGCTTAVSLDRGAHHESWIQRAGVNNAITIRPDQTTLYMIATPMKPRAFIWKP